MPLGIVLERVLEAPEQLLLLPTQIDRRLDDHPAEQIAGRATAHGFDALLTQSEYAPRLCLRGNLDRGVAIERGNLDRAAERGGRKAHRDLAGQVAAVPLEDLVLADADLDVEISSGAAVPPGLSFAGQADAVAVVDTGRHLDRQRLLRRRRPWPRQPLQGSVITWPRPWQRGQVCCTAKNPCCIRTWPAPRQVSQVDRLRALSRARSLALVALGQRRELDVGGGAEHGLLEIERELITQVGAAVDAGAVAPPAAEDVAEDLAEDVAEGVPRIEALASATRSIDAGVAKLVVGGALLRVGQDFVGLLDLLETALGLVVGGLRSGWYFIASRR